MLINKKSSTFAEDYEEPTALATDNGEIPILIGEDAERFIRMVEENERKIINSNI